MNHEHTVCPRCRVSFECRAGDIINCQCNAIQLEQDEKDFISRSYTGCLCVACLQELKKSLQEVKENTNLAGLRQQ